MSPVDPTRTLTTTKRKRLAPELNAQEQKEVAESASAKLAPGNTGATWAASSAIASVEKGDAVQASADVLRLTGETLKKSPVANNLSVSGSVISSLNKAVEGDTYTAAAHASAAVEKISPALANSTVGAVANAALLTASPEKLAESGKEMKKNAKALVSETASPDRKLKAFLDLSNATYNFSFLGRTIGNSAVKVGAFVLDKLTKVASVAPGAFKAQAAAAKIATSPLGQAFAKLNKWIPLLNVAGLVVSGKNAVDVFKNAKSSNTSKVLAGGSLALAFGSLAAGITLGFAPFLGIAAASILVDVGLTQSRKRDKDQGDTDAKMRVRFENPARGLRDLGAWLGQMGLGAVDFVREGFAKAKGNVQRQLAKI